MTPENRAKLADLIQTRKDELLAEWCNRIRPILMDRNIDTPVLNDELPHFLDRLGQRIRDIDTPYSWVERVDADTELSQTAGGHGKQRFQLGFDIVEVVKEYGVLREVILDCAEANSIIIGGEGGHVFHFAFNRAIAIAVETFQHEKDIETTKRRKEYLSFVMHDLKTPLNAIKIATHVLEQSIGDPRLVAEMLQIIIRNSERLDEFIQKTIEAAKSGISEGAEDLIPRNFELWPLVQSVMDEHKLIADNSRTSILNVIPANLTVYADAVALKTVFRNLLSNAIKYSPGGKIVVGVTTSGPDGIECWVRDTGVGIPAERLERIFEKGDIDPTQPGSTGLGLAVVKKIVEAHGGKVRDESKVGEGSTFCIILPNTPPIEIL